LEYFFGISKKSVHKFRKYILTTFYNFHKRKWSYVILQLNGQEWFTRNCGKEIRGTDYGKRVCMKQVGSQCPSGWIFHAAGNGHGKCYKYFVNGNAFQPWYEQRTYCQSIGARSLRIESGIIFVLLDVVLKTMRILL